MGKYFDALTVKQKRLPYAAYIDFPYSDPAVPDELVEKMSVPMDPKNALRVEDMCKLLDPSYHADDSGYCNMPDGSSYVGITMEFQGSKREMYEWWFMWNGLEDVRYKIWDPAAHIQSCVSAAQVAQRCDSRRSYRERFVNTTNFTVHLNADGTPGPGVMYLVDPADYGMVIPADQADDVSVVMALHSKAEYPYPTFSSVRVLRDTPNGFSMRLYFWYDKIILPGGGIMTLPHTIPITDLQPLAWHGAQEYKHLADLLPDLYDDNYQAKDDPSQFFTMPLLVRTADAD